MLGRLKFVLFSTLSFSHTPAQVNPQQRRRQHGNLKFHSHLRSPQMVLVVEARQKPVKLSRMLLASDIRPVRRGQFSKMLLGNVTR